MSSVGSGVSPPGLQILPAHLLHPQTHTPHHTQSAPFAHSIASPESHMMMMGGAEVPWADDDLAQDFQSLTEEAAQRAAGGGGPHSLLLQGATPHKELIARQQQQLHGRLGLGGMTPLDATTPLKQTVNDDDWPDTWSSVVSQITPQRIDTVTAATNELPSAAAHQYAQQMKLPQVTSALSQHIPLQAPAHLHHQSAALYQHPASVWGAEQEDAATELESPDDAFLPGVGPQPAQYNMARLSLNDESDFTQQQQQQHQQHQQQQHQQQQPSHQQHQPRYMQQHPQPLQQQAHFQTQPHQSMMHMQTQPQQHHLQQSQQQQPQQQGYGYQQQQQQQQQQAQYVQQPAPRQQQPMHHRQPSPPLTSGAYPGTSVRFQHAPGMWQSNNNSAPAHIAAPPQVLRTSSSHGGAPNNSFGFAPHSTSGPVRGIPTTQVGYQQQPQHQQHQQQAQMQQGGAYQRGHSQPLTPVGSYVATGPQHHMHQQVAPQQHSHSHPASPRAGAQPHPGSAHYSAVGSSVGSAAGSNAGSGFNTTPLNLSPHSSPVMSPHLSPQRFTKNHAHAHQHQHQHAPHAQQMHHLMPQQGGHMHIRGAGSIGSLSSLTSSGSNTPTAQAGPPFAASLAQAAASAFGSQQQHMQMQQGGGAPVVSMSAIQPGSSPNSRRSSGLAIQTGQQQQQQHAHNNNPYAMQSQSQSQSHHSHAHPYSHQQQMPQPGMLKINLPSGGGGGGGGPGCSSVSSTTPVNAAPVLSGDSPMSKSRFKTFYKELSALVKVDVDDAYAYGLRALQQSDHERIAWKIAMELADLAKRQNHVPRARHWYEQAHRLEPLASQVWIEHAKMEEECGELVRCEQLMQLGLQHCEFNEPLMTKSLRHYERVNKPEMARAILARLRDVPLDRVWRTVLEGGLMEARLGQLSTARRVFKYLMAHVSWFGPIYFECARVEERWGRFDLALQTVERGIAQMPRYGPLWFMAFRLLERTSTNFDVPRAHAQRALGHVSAELVWKMHFELAQMEERLGEYDRARDAYAASIHACPLNLRWKVWLSGARMELLSGDAARVTVARALLSRALDEVPKKMRCMVLLEQSRMHEFVGNLPAARAVLRAAQVEARLEWKVFLESVLLELRAGRIDAAIAEAKAALEVHNGTGRLWAILIQMCQKQSHAPGYRFGHTHGSLKEQWAIFRTAIKSVPKSGEVWCEGARICLNPYAPRYFNLKAAKRFLNFAVQFTPQYGDSFIEYLRLKMILEGMDETQQGLAAATMASAASTSAGGEGAAGAKDPFGCAPAHLRRVQQLCVNAEPNYGSSWFSCKREAHWAPVEVLQVAGEMIQRHLVANQRQYSHAILAGWYRKKPEPMALAEAAAAAAKAAKGISTFTDEHDAADSTGSIGGRSSVQQRLDEEAELAANAACQSPSPVHSQSISPSSGASCSRMSVASDESGEDATDVLALVEDSPAPVALASLAPLPPLSMDDDDASTMASDATFSPSTIRRAALVEAGESGLLSAACSPANSTRASSCDSQSMSAPSSAALTSEDDEDDLQAQCQPDAQFNSLQLLYPPIANLSVRDRHRALYGADPITP